MSKHKCDHGKNNDTYRRPRDSTRLEHECSCPVGKDHSENDFVYKKVGN